MTVFYDEPDRPVKRLITNPAELERKHASRSTKAKKQKKMPRLTTEFDFMSELWVVEIDCPYCMAFSVKGTSKYKGSATKAARAGFKTHECRNAPRGLG